MTTVTLRDLSKTYAGVQVPALDRLSLEIASGELVALLGPSGSGKTTALKLIAGLENPSDGDIAFEGRSILGDLPEVRGAVMVFQNYLLFPYMSVAENVGFGLKMRHVSRSEIAAQVEQFLAMVRLPGMGHRKPSELSGGQQQRVALARALILRPKVLLLDEPLSNLDANLRHDMRDLIRSLQREMRITTIFVTHDQEEAVSLADKVALILEGRLRQYDSADQFYKRPADEAVARFFGGQNFFPGRVQGGQFLSPLGPLTLPAGQIDRFGILTIRPEAVMIGAGDNAVTAVVADRLFLGTQTRLKLRLGDVELAAALPPDSVEDIAIGDTITVHLPRERLWIMGS